MHSLFKYYILTLKGEAENQPEMRPGTSTKGGTVYMVSDIEDLLQTEFPDEFITHPDKKWEAGKPDYIIE